MTVWRRMFIDPSTLTKTCRQAGSSPHRALAQFHLAPFPVWAKHLIRAPRRPNSR